MSERTSIALLLTINFALVVAPIALLVFAWRAWGRTEPPSTWRKWTALAGLVIESIASIAMPVLMLALETHTWARWIDRVEVETMGYAVVTGMAASLIATPLSAFAWGRIRWLTLPACLLTFALCYMAGMAMSF
ncbi:MAG: hypothetical protein ABSA94_07045 [Acidobacteriaceae bacterium]|jgi:hypothetical protein